MLNETLSLNKEEIESQGINFEEVKSIRKNQIVSILNELLLSPYLSEQTNELVNIACGLVNYKLGSFYFDLE